MPWLNHPKFQSVRNKVLEAVRKNEYRFRRTPNVLFLCGGKDSIPRERIAEYIRKQRPDTKVFYAEKVWSAIAKLDLSALEMEENLASLSDIVIIVVESPGTFAELGAFSSSPQLRKKLLPILESKYQHAQSFLETGPVRWIDKDSDFRPAIWVNHDRILDAATDLEARLNKVLPAPHSIKDLATSPKHLLFFICDLVSIFGPCPSAHIEYYVRSLLPHNTQSVLMLLRLGCAMGLLHTVNIETALELYYRPVEQDRLLAFHYTKKHLGLPSLKAQILGVMQSIESARRALSEFGRLS